MPAPGVPKISTAPNPFKILQEPKLIVVLYETFDLRRQFFMDGREVAKDAIRLGWAIQRQVGWRHARRRIPSVQRQVVAR